MITDDHRWSLIALRASGCRSATDELPLMTPDDA